MGPEHICWSRVCFPWDKEQQRHRRQQSPSRIGGIIRGSRIGEASPSGPASGQQQHQRRRQAPSALTEAPSLRISGNPSLGLLQHREGRLQLGLSCQTTHPADVLVIGAPHADCRFPLCLWAPIPPSPAPSLVYTDCSLLCLFRILFANARAYIFPADASHPDSYVPILCLMPKCPHAARFRGSGGQRGAVGIFLMAASGKAPPTGRVNLAQADTTSDRQGREGTAVIHRQILLPYSMPYTVSCCVVT